MNSRGVPIGKDETMSHSTRETLLRLTDQARNDLDRCMENLIQVSTIYGESHQNYSQFFSNVAQLVLQNQQLLEDFEKRYM